jgi:hypothetical protein
MALAVAVFAAEVAEISLRFAADAEETAVFL